MIRFIFITALSLLSVHISFAQKKKNRVYNSDTIATIQTSVQKADSIHAVHLHSPINDINAQLDLYKQHVLFYGFNQENHWTLLIKEDSCFIFVSNKDTLIFQYAKHTQVQDGIVVRYHSKNQLNMPKQDTVRKNITITIIEQSNTEGNPLVSYPFKLNVVIGDHTAKSSAYSSGSGFYIADPLLNNIWVLDSVNKKPIPKDLFPNGLPRIEFHLKDSRVHGFGGCNEFTGSFYIMQHQIHFNKTVTTLKQCVNMSGENLFIPLFANKNFNYSIQGLRLKLVNRDGAVLIFKKVD